MPVEDRAPVAEQQITVTGTVQQRRAEAAEAHAAAEKGGIGKVLLLA